MQRLMSRPVRDAHRVSVELDAELVARVEAVLAVMAEYGAQAVLDERAAQGKGIAPATAADVRAAVGKAGGNRDPLGLYADGVVSEFTNNLQQRATNVVLDQRRKDAPVGKQIVRALELLDDQSDGWIDAVASKGANAGFAGAVGWVCGVCG